MENRRKKVSRKCFYTSQKSSTSFKTFALVAKVFMDIAVFLEKHFFNIVLPQLLQVKKDVAAEVTLLSLCGAKLFLVCYKDRIMNITR